MLIYEKALQKGVFPESLAKFAVFGAYRFLRTAKIAKMSCFSDS